MDGSVADNTELLFLTREVGDFRGDLIQMTGELVPAFLSRFFQI